MLLSARDSVSLNQRARLLVSRTLLFVLMSSALLADGEVLLGQDRKAAPAGRPTASSQAEQRTDSRSEAMNVRNGTDTIVQLADEIELPRLIDLCAARLGITVHYDPATIQGKVNCRIGPDGLTNEELWDLTNHVLGLRGFAIIALTPTSSVENGVDEDESPGEAARPIYSVVRATEAANLAPIGTINRHEAGTSASDLRNGAPSPPPAGYVTVLIEPRFRDPRTLVDAVKPILSKQSGIVSNLGVNSNLIIISDTRSRIDQALRVIEMIDVPGSASQVERIPTRNQTASTLASSAMSVLAARETVDGRASLGRVLAEPDDRAVLIVAPVNEMEQLRRLIDQLDQEVELETKTYVPYHFDLAEVSALISQIVLESGGNASGSRSGTAGSHRGDRPRIVQNDLLGNLIITATPLQHNRIAELVNRLNAVPPESRRPLVTFTIRNRSVMDILGVLDNMIASGVIGNDDAITREVGRNDAGRPGSTAIQNENERRGDSRAGHSDALHANGESQSGRSPDIQPADSTSDTHNGSGGAPRSIANSSVMLTADEATSTIIASGPPRMLDQIETLIKQLDVRQPQVMLEILIVSLNDGQTFDLGVELEKVEIVDNVRIGLSSLFGLSSGTDVGGRTVDDPRGGTALVLSPGDFSVVVRALETINGGRTLNMPKVLVQNNEQAVLNSVLQEPFTSTNASDTVATTSFGGTQDAGTTATLKPQIAEGDHVVVEYEVTLSTFVGESTDPALPPPRQENSLRSVATVPDGFVVALGGLEVVNTADAVSQVPGFGSLPIIGELFKSRSQSESRSRFFVFIRPNIMRHESFESLKYFSASEVRSAELEDGWPKVEPRIIR
jgi:type II secretory pathway component GspD/PulD (secretin)